MNSKLINATVPFCTGVAHQKYLGAEKGLQTAIEGDCTHWYIDGSLFGEMVDDWTEARIESLQAQIAATGVKPVFMATSRRRWAVMSKPSVVRPWSTSKKKSISPAAWARR